MRAFEVTKLGRNEEIKALIVLWSQRELKKPKQKVINDRPIQQDNSSLGETKEFDKEPKKKEEETLVEKEKIKPTNSFPFPTKLRNREWEPRLKNVEGLDASKS